VRNVALNKEDKTESKEQRNIETEGQQVRQIHSNFSVADAVKLDTVNESKTKVSLSALLMRT
jgi:hypothetical protein